MADVDVACVPKVLDVPKKSGTLTYFVATSQVTDRLVSKWRKGLGLIIKKSKKFAISA